MVIALLLAHVIGDFVFQSENLAEEKKFSKEKKKEWIYAHLKHVGIHLAAIAFILVVLGVKINVDLVHIFALYLGSHFVIDILKSFINGNSSPSKFKVFIFLGDQLLHLIMIYMIGLFISDGTFSVDFGNIIYVLNVESSVLEYAFKALFLAIFIMYSGGIFVPLALDNMYKVYLKKYGSSKINNEDVKGIGKRISYLSIEKDIKELSKEIPEEFMDEYKFLYHKVSIGKYIGMMERLLIFIGLLASNYTIIIGVIGIKTWVRHKEFSNRSFSEYYLLGSMLSIVYSFIAFYSINSIFDLFQISFPI